MVQYEVEIKTLLGTKDQADAFVEALGKSKGTLTQKGSHKQLNHYFEGGSLENLCTTLKDLVTPEQLAELQDIAQASTDYSVRSRWADGKVIAVVKASVDATTSSNGTARREWEVPVDCSIEQLDDAILAAGFTYQAKWSRGRTEYTLSSTDSTGIAVSLDKNAGYGYLAELEQLVSDTTQIDSAKEALRTMLSTLGYEELDQERLARMFAHYNANWQDYYGTDKVFTVL